MQEWVSPRGANLFLLFCQKKVDEESEVSVQPDGASNVKPILGIAVLALVWMLFQRFSIGLRYFPV